MDQGYYLTRFEYDLGRKKVWKAICEYLNRYIKDDSSVLDLGSGYCDFINNIVAKRKTAVEINNNFRKFCNDEVDFLNADITKLKLDKGTFDTIFASNLLEHFKDSDLNALIRKIYELLKEKGTLILIQPNYYYAYREYWDDYTHIKAFSHISLSDFLVSNGFKIRMIKKRFLPYTFKSKVPKSYWLTKLYLASPWHPFAKQMLIIAEK